MIGWFLLGVCLIGFLGWVIYNCGKQRKLIDSFNDLSNDEKQAVGNLGLAYNLTLGKSVTCDLSPVVIQSLITKGIVVYSGFAAKSSTELSFSDLHLSEYGQQLYQVYQDSTSFDW